MTPKDFPIGNLNRKKEVIVRLFLCKQIVDYMIKTFPITLTAYGVFICLYRLSKQKTNEYIEERVLRVKD